jgi:serine/threonine-protein kinase RsbW
MNKTKSNSSKETITILANFRNLRIIREFISREARMSGFNDAEVYNIQLAVDEACANIIEHAYGGENRGDISCTCTITDKEFNIKLVDHGLPFNPAEVIKPDLHASLEERKPGGLGLYFIQQLMDEVTYSSSSTNDSDAKKSSENFLVLKKRRTPET